MKNSLDFPITRVLAKPFQAIGKLVTDEEILNDIPFVRENPNGSFTVVFRGCLFEDDPTPFYSLRYRMKNGKFEYVNASYRKVRDLNVFIASRK